MSTLERCLSITLWAGVSELVSLTATRVRSFSYSIVNSTTGKHISVAFINFLKYRFSDIEMSLSSERINYKPHLTMTSRHCRNVVLTF